MFGIIVTLVLAPLPAHAEQAQSVKEVLERYGLLGTFAGDCAKPVSKQNPYLVYRLLDANRVQYDLMTGPTDRANVGVIDAAAALGPNERRLFRTAWAHRDRYRRERDRYRLWTSTRQDGEKFVVNGRFPDDNTETQWFNRCE